ncbi:MAG: glycosyltransferase [Solibacillus sp.]
MNTVVVVIPAFNPLTSLLSFVERLLELAVEEVVVVDDGSDAKYSGIFEKLREIEHCVVLTHEENYGKGRALKTGFDYVLKSQWKMKDIITVGAHGQHSILDIEQIIASTKIFSDGIILGVREFKSSEVPVTTFVTNRAISMLFEFFFRKRLLDTQTGLRYVPNFLLPWLSAVHGESYNYDLNMLVAAIRRQIPIYEVPVGEAKLKKNSIIYYDEVLEPRQLFQQLWLNYINRE